jgi:hypothetical protein
MGTEFAIELYIATHVTNSPIQHSYKVVKKNSSLG